MPKNTATPTAWRISDPEPVETTSGSTPRMKANEVIRIGRRRPAQDREQHADLEHVETPIAAGDLLVHKIGSFEGEPARQRLLGELLHGVDRSGRTGARQRFPLQLRRPIEVVAPAAVETRNI